MLGAGQRSFDDKDLVFVDELRDPGSGKEEPFQSNSYWFFDLSAGLNLHYDGKDERSSIDFGLGAFHLNNPQVGFYGNH